MIGLTQIPASITAMKMNRSFKSIYISRGPGEPELMASLPVTASVGEKGKGHAEKASSQPG